MALRSGYKGFKKLLPGLKIIRPGTLGIDNAELSRTFFPRSEQAVTGVKNFYYFDSVIAGETNASYEVTATGIRVYNDSAGTFKKATVRMSKFPKNKDMILSWVMTVTSGAGSFGELKGSTDGSTWTDLAFEVVDTYARKINTGNYNYIKFVVNSTRATSETGNVTYSNIMLRFADESNADYVEPAMTNRELTEKARGIINAAVNAADFAAFKTAIGNL